MRTLPQMRPFQLFSVAEIPVRVHWAYLLLAAFFGYQFAPLGTVYPFLFVFCMTLALVVHELGHAFAARRYGLAPQVLLHGFGGLTFHQRSPSPKSDALIIAAGPAAGLVLSALAFGAVLYFGADVGPDGRPIVAVEHAPFWWTINTLFYISLVWNILNLIPLWPLDGGQLFRLLMLRLDKNAARAERRTHVIGIVIGVALAVLCVALWQSLFGAVIVVMLTFQNIQRLQALNGGGATSAAQARNDHADELLVMATRALAEGDAREALRLGYQVKDEKGLSSTQLDAMWSVLTVASAAVHEHDEALSYSLRAPRIGPVFLARLEALVGLGRVDEARRELAAPDVPPLTERQRAAAEALLA